MSIRAIYHSNHVRFIISHIQSFEPFVFLPLFSTDRQISIAQEAPRVQPLEQRRRRWTLARCQWHWSWAWTPLSILSQWHHLQNHGIEVPCALIWNDCRLIPLNSLESQRRRTKPASFALVEAHPEDTKCLVRFLNFWSPGSRSYPQDQLSTRECLHGGVISIGTYF